MLLYMYGWTYGITIYQVAALNKDFSKHIINIPKICCFFLFNCKNIKIAPDSTFKEIRRTCPGFIYILY